MVKKVEDPTLGRDGWPRLLKARGHHVFRHSVPTRYQSEVLRSAHPAEWRWIPGTRESRSDHPYPGPHQIRNCKHLWPV